MGVRGLARKPSGFLISENMERTAPKSLRLPDVVNFTTVDNFTRIPNEIIQDPKISSNAFKVYCILLGNSDTWVSYKQTIFNRMKCGYNSVDNALRELSGLGLVLRMYIRDKKTKRRRGSFLAVTDIPFTFTIPETKTFTDLMDSGFELHHENHDLGHIMKIMNMKSMIMLSNAYNNTNNNKNKNNKTKSSSDADSKIINSQFENFWKMYPNKTDKGKASSKWKTICNKPKSEKPTWNEIRTAIRLQKKSDRWKDPKFIPHPTTWLNQTRWMDDPKEMKVHMRQNNKPQNGTGSRCVSDENNVEYKEYDEIM